jgi:hypothetical protein
VPFHVWTHVQVDSFTVEGVGVPSPTSLKVTLQATQLSPSWHLDHIVCTVLEGGKDSTTGRKYYFVANRSEPCSSRMCLFAAHKSPLWNKC